MRYFSSLLNQFTNWRPSRLGQHVIYSGALAGGVLVGAFMANLIGLGSLTMADAGYPAKEYMARPIDVVARGLRTDQEIASLEMKPAEVSRPLEKVAARPPGKSRPRIVIIFDDMGMDAAAFARISSLPGPLTLSFLPYAPAAQTMATEARQRGHEVLLHLPMEPRASNIDPGPGALLVSDTAADLQRKLINNLAEFDGYVGVNNHMGSRLTADRNAMRVTLRELKRRDLYFVDSVTTGQSVVADVAEELGVSVIARDVFLDADHGEIGAPNVKVRLAELERLARRNGHAVAIAHPYRSTIETLTPWILSANLRGFEVTTISALNREFGENTQTLAALR